MATFSVLCKAAYQAARNHPIFTKAEIVMIWNCLVFVFRIFSPKLKSSWFQNKPFWRILSKGAIKYLPNSKTCPRTRIWSFYGCFKLLRNYSKWSQNDFDNYKIKKNDDCEPYGRNSKREEKLVICRRWAEAHERR